MLSKQLTAGLLYYILTGILFMKLPAPQAFTGLNKRGIKVLRPKQIVATADHNVPT